MSLLLSQRQLRSQALALYRQLLRAGRRWEDAEEGRYIQAESARLFRANRALQDKDLIARKLFEAQSRCASPPARPP
eukprot:SAG11_NODE_9636_length_893_cov_1.479849_1_plen_76_part_10